LTTAQPWLPPTALFDGALTAAVTRSVDTWRTRWIASSGHHPVRLDACNLLDILPDEGWSTVCGALRFHTDPKMKTRLAAAALQSQRAAQGHTAADRTFLAALCQKMACDLIDQHAGLFGVDSPCRPLLSNDAETPVALMRFRISGPGGLFGFLVASAGAAARARKSLAKTGENRPPLETRSRAIAHQPIKVAARVGSGRLSVAELGSLGAGDVLVLDRRTTDPLEAMFIDQRPASPNIRIARNGAALFLQITGKQTSGAA
jgi:flagellar motor switch/type III secretory pathway protein FliN